MEKTVMQRLEFLLLSLVLAVVVSIWRPAVYGNNEASIKQYIYQAMGQQLGAYPLWAAAAPANIRRRTIIM